MSASRQVNPFQSRAWLSLFFCFLIASTGCDSKTTSSPNLTLPPADSGTSSANSEPRVTVAEAEAFAEAWENCIETGEGKAGGELISWIGIVNRTLKPFKVDAEFRKGFTRGALSKIGPSFIDQMKTVLDNGGSYQLVKVISRAGKRHVVFRVVDPNSGLNYHDFQLERSNGKVRASHFFIAATGEEFADTLRNLVAPAIASSNSTFGKLNGEQTRQLKTLDDLKKMREAVNAGKKEKVLAIYNSLPAKSQEMKVILIMKMQYLDIEADEATYLETIDQYTKLFPNDPSLGLVTLDAAYLRKDFALLEQARSSLQTWTGGDPYVDLVIGNLLAELNKVEEAVQLTKDIDPGPLGLADAHDFKLTIALANKDYPSVLKGLRALRDQFGYQFSDLRDAEGFEGFVDSPEFSEWTAD